MLFNRFRYPLQPRHAAVCGCKPASFGIPDARKRPSISAKVVGSQPDSQAAPVAADGETPSAHQTKPRRNRYGTYEEYKEKRVKRYQETYDSLPPEEVARRNKIGAANAGKVPWNKGRKHSPEVLEKIRQRTKEAMQRKEVLEKTKQNRPPNVMTPERKARISESVKRTKSQQEITPEERERRAEIWRQQHQITPEERERRAESQRQRWQDPEYREMRMAKRSSPEAVAKRQADAEARAAAYAEARAAAYAEAQEAKEAKGAPRSPAPRRKLTPEQKAQKAEIQRQKWQDPEYREMMVARIRSADAAERRSEAVMRRKAEAAAGEPSGSTDPASQEAKPRQRRKTTAAAAGDPTPARPRRATKKELEAQAAQQATQAQVQRRVLEETNQKLVSAQTLVSKVESMAEELRSRAQLLVNDRKMYDAVMRNLAMMEDSLQQAYAEVARLKGIIDSSSVQFDRNGQVVHVGLGPAPASPPTQPDSPPSSQGPSPSGAAPTPQSRSVIEASSSLTISSIRPHMTDLDYQGGSSRGVDELAPRGRSSGDHDGSFMAAAAGQNGSHAPLGGLANGTHAQNGSQQAEHVNGHMYTSNGTNGTTYDAGSVSVPSGGKRPMTARGGTAEEEEEEGDDVA